MLIGILQTGHMPAELRPDTGNPTDLFQHLLARQGFTFRTWDVVDMDFPDGPTDADGWLITGSKHGAYEDHPFIPPLEDLIRAIMAADRPLVGVCFGHQIIAQAMGGRVEKFAGGWAVGRRGYDWQGETLHLNAWHQDQVVTAPETARTLASNDFCAHAALVYGQTALTVQPHPEFSAAVVDGLATHRAPGVVPDPLLDQVRADLDKPTDSARMATMIGRFFRERVTA